MLLYGLFQGVGLTLIVINHELVIASKTKARLLYLAHKMCSKSGKQ